MEKAEQHIGLLALVKGLLAERLPQGVGWPNTFGSALLALIGVQFVTGILLSLYYSPNAEVAYESVQFIEKHVVFGGVIRGIHHFAGSGMIILIFFHMLRTYFYGAYKRPRQWTWVFGVVLLLLVLGFAFTGYLLPWDMKAYFATKVGINIAGLVPLAGRYIVLVMRGGSEMGTLTLSRFFSLHVIVLPLSLLLAVAAHLFYVRLHGPTPPGLRNDEPVRYGGRFFPRQLLRDSVLTFATVAVIVVLAVYFGAPLEDKANPNDTMYIPRPDWYFYALFQLLKLFSGKLEVFGAILLPGLFFGLLVLLPFIDRNPERKLRQRPIAALTGAATVFMVLVLTAWGAIEGERAKQRMAASRETVTVEGEVEDMFVVDPQIGKYLFEQLKCAGCHASASQGVNIPPGLAFAGNKYQQSWLVSYLQHPYRIRWQKKDQRPVIRMPDFDLNDSEALNLSAYLTTLTASHTSPPWEFDWAETDSEMVLSGEELIADYSCTGCHKIGNAGQNIGPELTHVGAKLQASYMFQIIRAPEKAVPGTSMKNFKLDVEEIEDIVAYLRTLK